MESVPGPSALIAAITASGLPTNEFHFVGFLPTRAGQRQKKIESLQNTSGTLVFYESPYRVTKLLNELSLIFPDATVVLARELTKKFEEFLRGTAAALLALTKNRTLKGEFVVLVDRPISTAKSKVN